MIFQHTLEKVLDGTKTQTRRIVKEGQWRLFGEYANGEFPIIAIVSNERPLYRAGNIYAVQGGRGQKGVARIEITKIRQEDVREISDSDVKAEGFATKEEFLTVWCSMHNDNYEAWVIDFKLCTI